MASKRIDVQVSGKDNTSSAFSSVSKNISKLGTEAGKSGTTIGQSISKGASTASTAIGKLGSTASSAFQKIASGASSAGKSIASSMDSASGALTGLVGSLGAYEIAQSAWTGATTADFNKQFLATKMSTAAANQYVASIQSIVAAVPGPDTWMNNLLSGAVQKQTNISTSALSALGSAAADYYLTSTQMGKSSIETQNDLNEYIKTGNTTQLERDSILKDQLDLLEGQTTVEGRIQALQAALVADGYSGVSQLQTASNYWEQFNGLIGKSATYLGNIVLPAISSILSGLIGLDEATNGWSTNIIVIGGLLVGMVSTIGLISGPLSAMIGVWKTVGSGIKTAVVRLWEYVVAAKAADKADDGIGSGTNTGGKITAKNVASGVSIVAGVAAATYAVTQMWDAANQGAIKTLSTANYLEQDENGVFHEQFWQSPIPAINDFNNSIGLGTQNAVDVAKNAGAGLQASLSGVWSSMSSGAAAGWNSIRSGAMSAFSGITGAWNSLKSLVGAGASGVVSIFGPTIASIRSAVSSLWGLVRQGAQGVVSIISSGLSAVRSAVSSLYSMVRAGASGVVSIVQSIISGPGGPRGPAGSLSGISFKYENYGGWQKNAWTSETSMSGNCADMTAGLISRYGGSYVQGTWNGNPHVWWRDPSGKEFDPARYALNGTGSPPPRGPSVGASGTNIIIQGDIYGYDDFVSKVAQATGSMTKSIRRI